MIDVLLAIYRGAVVQKELDDEEHCKEDGHHDLSTADQPDVDFNFSLYRRHLVHSATVLLVSAHEVQGYCETGS